MDFRNISAWSIRNPVVPIILFIGLMLLGVVSFMQMKINDMPDIEFPAVMVQISQPGAAPTEIETQITQKVESAVRAIKGVDTLSSTASEGNSSTVVMFQIGIDVDEAVNEVRNAIDQARGELPDGIMEPRVIKMESGGAEIAGWAVSAEDMTLEQLSWFVDDTVAKRLLAIPGMAQVDRGGGVNREIRVTLDPARMQSLGVTATQVNSALRSLNVNAAGGKAEIAGSRQSVRVLGNARTAYELSQTDVPLGGGRTVKLADFADVRDSYAEVTSLGKVKGKSAVTFEITRAKGASDVAVYDETVKELEKIQKENPGLRFSRLFSSVDYTRGQYDSSIAAMVEGAILAVIVVFFFLRDWRATVISAIAIPLSAIPTFWFLYSWFGFSLNSLSLLALGLVAGVLVDDAIVEIENIVRHMRMGKSAYQASIDAADEIGLAVVATTFSIVAVFLPVGLMGGIPGQFFKSFGLTVVTSVLLSLAVARMITPMIAAYFLKSHGIAEHAGGKWMDRYLNILRWTLDDSKAKAMRARIVEQPARVYYYPIWIVASLLVFAVFSVGVALPIQAVNMSKLLSKVIPAWFSLLVGIGLGLVIAMLFYRLLRLVMPVFGRGFRAWYRYMDERFVARLNDHRIWMVGVGAGSLIMTVGLFASTPAQFFPTVNSDFSAVGIEMVPGTTLAQTEAVADRVAAIVEQDPNVATAFERVREGNARVFINLKRDRELTSQEFERRLAPKLQEIPDARVAFQDMSGPSGPGGPGRPIQIMLSGTNTEVLERTAAQLAEEMKTVPGLVAPRVAADMRRPEVIIKPNLDLAASLGVTTQALSQAIRIATIGDIDQNAAKFSLNDRQVPIRVRLSEDARRNISSIQNLPVPTATGGSVPLAAIAEITIGSGPVSIQRYNQNRRVFVGADLAEGVVKGAAMSEIAKLPTMKNLPAGVSNAPFGQDRWQADMVSSFAQALVAGVFLVFAVLVLLYHRFVSPLVNMGSLFLAPLGGMIALLLAGQPISLPVFIGVLMLFGIVAKNSILLVDFAIEEMSKGADKFSAIIEAGHKRAQPIIMTTVAMTAGMVPTAISISGDGAWRAPMGTVVIGGLVLSTLLTLVIVPAGFSLADGFEKRVGPMLRKKFLTYQPEDEHRANYPAAVPDLPPKALAAE
ncbi:efflux RND transporter permease subunit [Novosphingobium sp. TH158]|uniref:efflux RND transporter permease subunit n=1 Tax=Novosphingobium sp. TH158 TaxID=2067455 RepID=UPI000C7DC2CF|nr:efflux RND transporter permease subunit [Novosphingobium sp. TH158]PLK27139.1 transporter [Novosphingobium sp. TH158]